MSSVGFAWKAARRILGSDYTQLRTVPPAQRELFAESLVQFIKLPPDDRRLLIRASDHSMASLERLHRLLTLAGSLPPRVEGVVAEFGVAGGGSAALLGSIAHRTGRELWLFDSFEGLPEPDPRDGDEARVYAGGRNNGSLAPIGKCVGDLETVRRVLIDEFELDPDDIHFVKGWFQETRSDFPDLPIAFLHLDGDWYDSVWTVLEHYFDLVSPGGIVVFDDYGWWSGCRDAVDTFVHERSLASWFAREGQHGVIRVPLGARQS